MKSNDKIAKDLRNVLRSGGLPKQKNESSKPSLVLDLSKGALNYRPSNSQMDGLGSSSRENKTPRLNRSTRPGAKDKDNSLMNSTEQSFRSRDMLDSYRTSRNLHNLNKDDIFKRLRRDEHSENKSTVSNSNQSRSRFIHLGKSNQKIYRLARESASLVGHTKSERRDEIAKKIDFSLNSISAEKGRYGEGVKLHRSKWEHKNLTNREEPDEEVISQQAKKNLFSNGMDMFGRRNRAVEYITMPCVELSNPDNEEMSKKSRKREHYGDSNTESSIKPFGSVHEVTGLTGITISDVSKGHGMEEDSVPKSYPDSTLMLFEDKKKSFGPIEKNLPLGERDLNCQRNLGRATNLESMKTIKEAEEKDEIMGYTSQKETQNQGYLQGSFQNLLDKYCGNRESNALLESSTKSSHLLRSTFLLEEKKRFEEARLYAAENQSEWKEKKVVEDCISSDQKDNPYQVQLIPNINFKSESQATSKENSNLKPDLYLGIAQTTRDYRDSSKNNDNAKNLILYESEHSFLTKKENLSKAYSSRNYGSLARREMSIDKEIEKILRTLDKENEENQQLYRKERIADFKQLEGVNDPIFLKKIIRDLELENREKQVELIKMNMQVQDFSRLTRVLVRKVNSNQKSN